MNVVSKRKDLGVHVMSDFKWADWCAVAAKKTKGDLFRLSSEPSTTFVHLHDAFVRLSLDYCNPALWPFFHKGEDCLELERLAARMSEDRRQKTYGQRLGGLGVFALERRRVQGDPIDTLKLVKSKRTLFPYCFPRRP